MLQRLLWRPIVELDDVVAEYAAIRPQVEIIAPDRARSLEDSIDASKRSLEQGDLRATLEATQELRTRLKELADRLPAMQAELESTWTDLDASVPGTLTSLSQVIRRTKRPLEGPGRVAYDAARNDLPLLKAQWRDAENAMHDGRLAEAVNKAERVRSRATRVLADMQGGS